jgi:hypothetical protein
VTTAREKERIAKGLCPRCGKEAAPYYLCQSCRYGDRIVRMLNRGHKGGGFKKERRGNTNYWSIGDASAIDKIKWQPDPKPGDKRRLPRFRGVPIEIEQAVLGALESIGRPATLEEIIAAWVRLKADRGGGAVSHHLVAIIKADDRRARKNARRAALAQSGATA